MVIVKKKMCYWNNIILFDVNLLVFYIILYDINDLIIINCYDIKLNNVIITMYN